MKIVLEDAGFDWGEIDTRCLRCKYQYGCGIRKALHHVDDGIREHTGLRAFMMECDNYELWGRVGKQSET